VREHFLAQRPRLLLHEASPGSLTVLLGVPDDSLCEDGKVWRVGGVCVCVWGGGGQGCARVRVCV
jgi:hypothetical protein